MRTLPDDDDGTTRYCTTPDCHTTWKRLPMCPVCERSAGVPGPRQPIDWPHIRLPIGWRP